MRSREQGAWSRRFPVALGYTAGICRGEVQGSTRPALPSGRGGDQQDGATQTRRIPAPRSLLPARPPALPDRSSCLYCLFIKPQAAGWSRSLKTPIPLWRLTPEEFVLAAFSCAFGYFGQTLPTASNRAGGRPAFEVAARLRQNPVGVLPQTISLMQRPTAIEASSAVSIPHKHLALSVGRCVLKSNAGCPRRAPKTPRRVAGSICRSSLPPASQVGRPRLAGSSYLPAPLGKEAATEA